MTSEVDVVLVGTGLAPLVAAQQLRSQGKEVLLLNPDYDFFREDSELCLDPFWPIRKEHEILITDRILRSSPERAYEILKPFFPGSLELWKPQKKEKATS